MNVPLRVCVSVWWSVNVSLSSFAWNCWLPIFVPMYAIKPFYHCHSDGNFVRFYSPLVTITHWAHKRNEKLKRRRRKKKRKKTDRINIWIFYIFQEWLSCKKSKREHFPAVDWFYTVKIAYVIPHGMSSAQRPTWIARDDDASTTMMMMTTTNYY